MEYPTYDSKPASHNPIFDGAKELAEYDRNLRMRGVGPSQGKELDAPNVAEPGVKSIDVGASDFRPGPKDPLKAYNDRIEQEIETRFVEAGERSKRYSEELKAQVLRNDELFQSWRSPNDFGARLEMAEQIRKQEQQEPKEHKKGWFKYMPW